MVATALSCIEYASRSLNGSVYYTNSQYTHTHTQLKLKIYNIDTGNLIARNIIIAWEWLKRGGRPEGEATRLHISDVRFLILDHENGVHLIRVSHNVRSALCLIFHFSSQFLSLCVYVFVTFSLISSALSLFFLQIISARRLYSTLFAYCIHRNALVCSSPGTLQMTQHISRCRLK